MEKQDKLTIVGGQASGGNQPLFSTAIEKLLLRALSYENLKQSLLHDRKSILNNPEFTLSPQDKAILERIPPARLKDMLERFSSQRETRRNFLKGAAATVALLATAFVNVNAAELTPTPVATPINTPTSILNQIFIPTTTGIRPEKEFDVTHMEFQTKIKNLYTSKSGYHFCILNVYWMNIRDEYYHPGTHVLFDTKENEYEYLKEISKFWLEAVPPGGNNFGHIVFEIPIDAIPEKLVLFDNRNKPLITIPVPKYEK